MFFLFSLPLIFRFNFVFKAVQWLFPLFCCNSLLRFFLLHKLKQVPSSPVFESDYIKTWYPQVFFILSFRCFSEHDMTDLFGNLHGFVPSISASLWVYISFLLPQSPLTRSFTGLLSFTWRTSPFWFEFYSDITPQIWANQTVYF